MAKVVTVTGRVLLDLSLEEATFLYDLLGQCVIGDGKRRNLSSQMFDALADQPHISHDEWAGDLFGLVHIRDHS